MTSKIIGAVTTYLGTDHPFIKERQVVIVAVHKGVLVSPDDYLICRTDVDISAAGGIDHDTDLVEVAPVHANGRVSWVTSDARVHDLEMFR